MFCQSSVMVSDSNMTKSTVGRPILTCLIQDTYNVNPFMNTKVLTILVDNEQNA